MKYPISQVYMIRHNITGRMYIGKSQDVTKRTYQHLQKLRYGKHPVEDMQSDFDKYGEDYTVSIIGEACGINYDLELKTMDKYQSTIRGVGYNYKDPHATNAIRNAQKERSPKAQIRSLVDTLATSQVEAAYKALTNIFSCGDPIKTKYILDIVETLDKVEDFEFLDFMLQFATKSIK